MTHEIPFELSVADEARLAELLPLVRAYHAFDGIDMSDAQRAEAVAPLLPADSPLGRIWLIETGGRTVGYVALCLGYSIEFRGRDAFVDELYLVEQARGQGLGSRVLERVRAEARGMGIAALHLEVARDNARARALYEKWGFRTREQFTLMSCSLLPAAA